MTPMSFTEFHSLIVERLRRELASAGPGAIFDLGQYAAEAGLNDQQYPILEIEKLERDGYAKSVADNSLAIRLTPEGILWLEAPPASQPTPPIKQATEWPGAGPRPLDLARTKARGIEAEMIDKISTETAAVLARHGKSGMRGGTPTVHSIHEAILTSFMEALGLLSETYLAASDAGEPSDAISSDFTGHAGKLREVAWNIAIDAARKHSGGAEVATGRIDAQLRTAEESTKAEFGLAMAKWQRGEASQPAGRASARAVTNSRGGAPGPDLGPVGFNAYYHVVPPRKHVGLLPGAFSDRVSDADHLSFAPYIETLADLIESPGTELPVTIGIYGRWGTGKSFLLEHIKRLLEARRKSRGSVRGSSHAPAGVFPVMFNAWEYGAAQAIWPRLVRRILDDLDKELFKNWLLRVYWRVWRNLRHHWRTGWNQTITQALFALAAVVLGILLLPRTWGSGAKATFGILVPLLVLFFNRAFRHPLSGALAGLFSPRSYGELLEHYDEIRSDLDGIRKALEKKQVRALVLIDDLDRCAPERAVEVLQSLHFLLNFPNPFVICLAVDPDVLSAAVEQVHRGTLEARRVSGYDYLDKMVQIPFSIPEPSQAEATGFLSGHLAPTPATAGEGIAAGPVSPAPDQSRATLPMPEEDLLMPMAAFSPEESEAFVRLSPFVRRNPRHMKRLVNVYRLVRALAQRRSEGFVLRDFGKTLCWVLLCVQWPAQAGLLLQRARTMPHNTGDIHDVFGSPFRFLAKDLGERGTGGIEYALELGALLRETELEPSWDQLARLSRFTISFIPPVPRPGASPAPPSA